MLSFLLHVYNFVTRISLIERAFNSLLNNIFQFRTRAAVEFYYYGEENLKMTLEAPRKMYISSTRISLVYVLFRHRQVKGRHKNENPDKSTYDLLFLD